MRRSTWEVHCSLLLGLSVTALAVACHDVAGPAGPVASVSSAVIAPPPARVIVWPEDMHGWSFVEGAQSTPCADAARCGMVRGPATPPVGTGSAALSATPGSGSAIVLRAHGGVPLERITALRYASYAFGAPDGELSTVALELDVEYDETRPSEGDAGRLVYEPPRADVAAERWQGWDARAGMWWSTRGAARAGAGAEAHPCVQSRPCTWSALLARFPNMRLASGGGIRLAVRAGSALRANADSVVIGLDGASTLYDFELESPPVLHPLTHHFTDGVIVDRFPSDTLVRAGTAVDYAFSSRPGRAAPIVILDDTLVMPPEGRVVMDGPHVLHVVSDTVYSYATLTPVERTLADLLRQLLLATDKVAAADALNAAIVEQVNGGAGPEAVARAASVAQQVTIDVQRDSAALDAIDAALAGRDFTYRFAGPGQLTAFSTRGIPEWHDPVAAARIATGSLRGAMTGAAPRLTTSLRPAGATIERVANPSPENPQEQTRILYTNGVWTQYADALTSAALLAGIVYAEPRFGNRQTAVTLHYNPTRSEQMKRFDAAHPCTRPFIAGATFGSLQRRLIAYAVCKGIRYATALTSSDLVESVTTRFQQELALPATNDAVVGLSRMIGAYRAGGSHVLLVGHSEGVIVQAGAVGLLPALERHALQAAPRCVAVLALAPPTQRASYELDEHHLKGLLAMQDIIRVTLPTGWEDVDTPLSGTLREEMRADERSAAFLAMIVGTQIHSVNDTYLGGNLAPVVRARLTTLHRECLPGSAEITLSSTVVPIQQVMTASLAVWNQNNRPLTGRPPSFAGTTYLFDQLDSTTFRAMVPSDNQIRVFGRVTKGFDVTTFVRIPLVRPEFTIRDTPLSQWVSTGAQSGPDGRWSEVSPPTDPWNGTPGTCTKVVRYYGGYGDWHDFERRCNHLYTPVFAPADTLPGGRPIVGATVYYTYANGTTALGPSNYYFCAGEAPCITSGYLELNGEIGVVGRSLVTTPSLAPSP